MSDQLLTRLENAVARLEKIAGVQSSQSLAESEPKWIQACEREYINTILAEFQAASKNTHAPEINQASDLFVKLNHVLLDLIRKSQGSPKPSSPPEVQQFLLPASALMQKLQPDNRSDFFPNQKAVAEAMSLVLMVTSPAPATHLQSVLEAADFHLIKVLRKKVDTETAWVKQLKACLQWLINWAGENFKMGLVWNMRTGTGSATPGSKAKAPGPPPPPSTAAGGLKASVAPTTASGGFGDVLKQLESGGFCLKKAAKYQEPGALMDIERAKVKRPFVGRKYEPKVLLERDCWYVEGHRDTKQGQVQLKDTNMRQSVYIGKCENAAVEVSGKVKTIKIDGCENLNIVLESVISTIEIVNCRKVNLQITGNVPSLSVDKTDGVQVYLSEASVNLDLTTAKSSEINVNVPVGEGDWKELVVPEQFVHKVQNNKVISRVSDLYG